MRLTITFFGVSMNLINDLIPKSIFKNWGIFNHETKINLTFKYLIKKLEQEPDYEVFVKLLYCKNTFYTKPIIEYREFEDVLISNKGRILKVSTGEFYKGTVTFNGYHVFTSDKYVMCRHRAIAYNFIPKPKRHIDKTYAVLEVNHIDGDKNNNDISNLEWMTHEENLKHAIDNGLRKPLFGMAHGNVIPMLGTVVDIPGYEGTQFVLVGQKECNENYISHKTLYSARNRDGKCTYKGCTWKPIPIEEVGYYQRGPSEELKELIKKFKYERKGKGVISRRKYVYIATHLETGEETRYHGTLELVNAGFLYQNVLKCVKGKRKHTKGYEFRVEVL